MMGLKHEIKRRQSVAAGVLLPASSPTTHQPPSHGMSPVEHVSHHVPDIGHPPSHIGTSTDSQVRLVHGLAVLCP